MNVCVFIILTLFRNYHFLSLSSISSPSTLPWTTDIFATLQNGSKNVPRNPEEVSLPLSKLRYCSVRCEDGETIKKEPDEKLLKEDRGADRECNGDMDLWRSCKRMEATEEDGMERIN